MINRTGTVVFAAAVALAAGLPAAPVEAAETLTWSPCATTAKDWPYKDDTKLECALLTVPMDYADPQGRKIKVAVSRLKAADPGKRRGVLVLSPGGPGLFNLDSPLGFAGKALGDLATDHDVIGFDPRGTGYSDNIDCPEDPYPQLPPTATRKEQAKSDFDHQAGMNKRCTATDPAFVQQLTTANIARDVDGIRAALGEEKISFFGVSYGTAVGVNYRSMFDDRVARMWLDSVLPPVMDSSAMNATIDALTDTFFDEFVPWLARYDYEYHFGTTADAVRKTLFDLRDKLYREPLISGTTVLDGEWVNGVISPSPQNWVTNARDLAIVREGGVPQWAQATQGAARVLGFDNPDLGMNTLQYNAILCNDGTGGRDFEQMWADKEARQRSFETGGTLQWGIYCAGWPWPARQWEPVKGRSPLQLSGHTTESTTPYAWAVATRDTVGGTLLTIDDNEHGSLSKLPACAAKAVDFFRTGRTSRGTCPGVR
jgi:pimeloyl-ACP methyl ester carboxylesterase